MAKEIYIDFIIEELEKGNVKYNDVMLVFVSKFELTEQTFVRYWKKANEVYSERRSLINEAKLNEAINQEKEAVKTLLLSKVDRMRIAEDIALGESFESNGKIITPTPSERMKALEYLSKIDGDFATTKVEQTNTVIEVIRRDADSIE